MDLSYNLKKTRVLIIGTSRIHDSSFQLIPIISDIENLHKTLKDNTIAGIPSENITVLVNSKNYEVQRTLEQICNKYDTETLIVYYIGHTIQTNHNEIFLMFENSNINDIQISGLDYRNIHQIINNSPVENKVLFLDTCVSGLATLNDNSDTFFGNVKLNTKGTFIITNASKMDFNTSVSNGFHTSLTKEFLTILNSGIDNGKAYISFIELFQAISNNFLQKKLPSPIMLSSYSDDFYIVKNAKYNNKSEIEVLYFNKAKTTSEYKEYLSLFPNGQFIEKVKEKIEIVAKKDNEVKELFTFELCKSKNNLLKFIELFHYSDLVSNAKEKIDRLSETIDKEFIEIIKQKIANAETDKIFQLFWSKKTEYYNDLILLSNQWNELNLQSIRNVISNSEYLLERNRINNSLIRLVSIIEKQIDR